MSLEGTAVVFGAILFSCVVASALHELTHYFVAIALGRDATFVLDEWAVHYESAQTVGTAEVIIAGAPVPVGLSVGVAALLAGVTPLWLAPAWWLYTLHGAVTNDFKFTTVQAA